VITQQLPSEVITGWVILPRSLRFKADG